MLGTTYGHGILRDYVVAFGTLFNDISIIRKNAAGDISTYVRVPLSYAPKERFIARLNQDPNLTRAVALTLPRMSFEMTTMNYAGERKLNTINKIYKFTDDSGVADLSRVFSPVPYDIGFSLHIYTKNTEDASNVVEQVLPFFTPEFTLSIKSMTDLAIKVDAPIVLNGISKEDTYEGGFEERRTLIWTLDFTLKGVLFGPIAANKGLIKKAFIEFYTPSQYSVETANALSSKKVSHGQPATTLPFNQIRLANTASKTQGYYEGATINVTSGPGTGVFGTERKITKYIGATQIANVSPAFSAAPTENSIYRLEFNIPDDEYNAGDINLGTQNAAKLASRVYLEAGMTANGIPTTNSELSVGVNFIDANDDYGIIETTTFFDSGMRRNLTTGQDEHN